MQLWLVVQPVGKDPTDVAIEVPAVRLPAQSVVDALAQHLNADGGRPAAYSPRSRAWIKGDEPLSSLDLRVGDRLILSPEGPLETRERQASHDEVPFRLAVVGGRLAGLRIGLANGEHILGRGDGATVVLDDPSLAEQQVRIRVSPDGVHLAGSAPAPETLVEDEPLGRERSVEPGQLVRAGQTLLVFERREPREPPPAGRNGLVPFNRPPQVLAEARPAAPRSAGAADGDTGDADSAAGSGAPALGPCPRPWLFTKNPVSLVFAALSPLMAHPE